MNKKLFNKLRMEDKKKIYFNFSKIITNLIAN